MIAQPSGCGPEAIFNYAVNLNTLSMLRSLGSFNQEKTVKVTNNINIGKYL